MGHLLDYDSLISGAANTRPVDKLAPRVTDGLLPLETSANIANATADWATCGAWTQTMRRYQPGGFDADRDIAQAPEAAPADADFLSWRANAFHAGTSEIITRLLFRVASVGTALHRELRG